MNETLKQNIMNFVSQNFGDDTVMIYYPNTYPTPIAGTMQDVKDSIGTDNEAYGFNIPLKPSMKTVSGLMELYDLATVN